ncbi:MAG: carboxypeptidase regulatory-like domain-containing protein [Deltaproteobacteria bacterium]|nr:MAG: carboxypeptidase regulatory-like domain-containing protein [Deltaproteobacteria bacterium]
MDASIVTILRNRLGLGICAILLVAPLPALAATIAGTVTDGNANPRAGVRVEAWTPGPKGYECSSCPTAVTGSNGGYTLTVPAGTYKLFVRVPPGVVSNNQADHWYDINSPTNGGWTEAEADEVTVAASDALTGFDIVMPGGGSYSGRVRGNGNLLGGIYVRMERVTDPDQHHNTVSLFHTGPAPSGGRIQTGWWYAYGLQSAQHRIIVYDPQGRYLTQVFDNAGAFYTPVNATSGAPYNYPASDAGILDLNAAPADPYEGMSGNNDNLNATVVTPPFQSMDAAIYPRGSDVDWYCWTANAGDRYVVDVRSEIDVGGTLRLHPWFDPIVQITAFNNPRVDEDDDGGPGLSAHGDTGEIVSPGQYCAVVSTYGDTFPVLDGVGQQTAGPYTIEIRMGNRRPTMTCTYSVNGGASMILVDGGNIAIDEGDQLTISCAYTDPDGDTVSGTVTHLDNASSQVTDGTATNDPTLQTLTYTWTVPQDGGQHSPYSVTVAVDDGEFTTDLQANVIVNTVNIPPPTPTLVDPADGSVVTSDTPALVVQEVVDQDPTDQPYYEIEVYYGTNMGTPDQVGTAPYVDSMSTTSFTPAPLPENTVIFWRARANDGNGGLSPWTEFWSFFVNVANDPPLAPTLLKPVQDEVVSTRTPVLEAQNTSDPDNEPVTLYFQVADDEMFTSVVAESTMGVPQSTMSTTTTWQVDTPLMWGGVYWARVWAEDAAGAMSPYSNVVRFEVKANGIPMDVPGFAEPLAGAACENYVYTMVPSEILVYNTTDPDGEALTLELQIFNYGDNPDTAAPIYETSVPQNPNDGVTTIPLGAGLMDNGHYLVRVRATDGFDYSGWTSCDFWVNTVNDQPTAVQIISPEAGTEFSPDTTEVTVEVKNATDPDYGIPGTSLSIAYCVTTMEDFSDCGDASTWPAVPQSSGDPNETTTFTVDGLTQGDARWVRACARDESGLCGPSDETHFSIATAGGTDNGGGSGSTPGGCCSSARSGGEPALALFAAFGLLALRLRRRR